MHEGNMGAPNYHISQRKLSDDVIKAMGGRLPSPRESWTEAHSRNVARHLAIEFRKRQLDAADVATRQRIQKASATQPVANGAASMEPSHKYQQGSMQLASSLAEPSAWVSPTGISPGMVNAASLNGAAPGHMQTPPWIPPQADVLKGINQLPNIVGAAKAHGQPVMDQSVLMAPIRPGGGFRSVVPQLTSIPRHSAEGQMQGRTTRSIRTPHHQMPVAAAAYGHPQHNLQQQVEQVCDFDLSLSSRRN